MLLYCTKKLVAKLPAVSATPLVEARPLGNWHAHLLTYNRCLFVTEELEAII